MRLKRWLFLLLAPLIPLTEDAVDRRLGRFPSQEEVLYLWSGEHIKRLSTGFEDLMADIYWLRTVQYYGGQRAFSTAKRYELLYPLIDITTTLDPRLEIAYRYGAMFLCEPWPNGKGDAEAGIRILEKGVKALPSSWRIRQDLGYFRYIFLKDAVGGAKVLLEAAKVPGAPLWLETLAVAILTRGADRETARMVWKRLAEQAEEGVLKENARYNLQRLDARDAIDALNGFVRRFTDNHGRPPLDVKELLSQEAIDRPLLADPTGVPFDYDPQKGRFWFARRSMLWRSY